MDVRVVTVIGVTGVMGRNVAGIFASFGNAKVYCVGRDIDRVREMIPMIVNSVKADAIARNLIPQDYSSLASCVADSDLVFESVAEDINVKKSIAQQVGEALQEHAVSCTGTSGLSIEEIAACYPDQLRNRFFGVHMFNPPYSMPLCELISTRHSDEAVKAELKEYLGKKLYRTVVETKDEPAFLGNRIGFQFINMALQFAEKYKDKGGIDFIDAIFGPFTGRAMAPLATADFVGLDVHKAIVDNVYNNTNDYMHDSFVFPDFAVQLVQSGKLGRKSQGGLYQLIRKETGEKKQKVYDIASGEYRDKREYTIPFVEAMKAHLYEGDYSDAFKVLMYDDSEEAQICRRGLLQYMVYSLWLSNEVGYSIHAADDVMATGFKWCPPLAMYGAFSEASDVSAMIDKVLRDGIGANADDLLKDMVASKYDYRPFFKSGR